MGGKCKCCCWTRGCWREHSNEAHQIQHNHRAWGICRRHRRSGLRSGAPCTKKQQNRHDHSDHSFFCAHNSQYEHVVLCVNDGNADTTVVMMIDDNRRVLDELAALVVLVLL